jgi:hypothetical protein
MIVGMTASRTAAELATARVAAARDDPAQRLALAANNFECGLSPGASWRRFARSELAFLRSEIARGVLRRPQGGRPGSPWWRAVNERLLCDTVEATLLAQGYPGPPTSHTVELWLAFADEPSAASWYRAHNATIVAAYLEHEPLAQRELLAERFVINVALLRVLYAHALAAAPRLALGRLAPLGRLFGDPRGGTVDVFLSIKRGFPDRYPLTGISVDDLLADERRLLRSVDYGVIVGRTDALYAFAARSLGEPRVRDLVNDGVPAYVWPSDAREPWLDREGRVVTRLLGWVTGLPMRTPPSGRPCSSAGDRC